MKILLVDNYDSFTWNVFDLIATTTGEEPTVIRNDDPNLPDLDAFDAFVLSPGPGHPARVRDFGICADIVARRDLPVLGICLGHQGLCHFNGGTVSHAPRPVHGEIDEVFHQGDSILAGIPSPFRVVRYHSLEARALPANFTAIAATADGINMAVAAKDRPHWGVQFHPESACSEFGADIIRNFVALAAAARPLRLAEEKQQIHIERVPLEVDPQIVFDRHYRDARHALWLDSSASGGGSRFSFICDPGGPLFERLSYHVNGRRLSVEKGGQTRDRIGIDLLDHLETLVCARRMPVPSGLPFDFNLGYLGYFGYELKGLTDGSMAHSSTRPDAQFCFVDRMLTYDHLSGEYWLLALSTNSEEWTAARDWLSATRRRLVACQGAEPVRAKGAPPNVRPVRLRHGKTGYVDRIARALKDIRDGETYEVCLTNMATTACDEQGLDVYYRLRHLSPVPFGAYLKFGETEVLCGSPERFLSVSAAGQVESSPIKGTRPVDPDPETDRKLVEDLASNAKDRAENLMIVDLVRNDLTRCCKPGSVKVASMFAVESYALVHQLVSTVQGQLAPGNTALDAIRATFPGGSMTGAPKIRTMEIIDRLEEGPRGIYSGSIGYLALSGAADFNIVIRTIVLENGQATFGMGGAIIALSDPEDEWEETLVKARSSLRALGTELGGNVPVEKAN